MIKKENKLPPITFQWHITERCNWNCKHCYQDKRVAEEGELDIEELKKTVDKFVLFLEQRGAKKTKKGVCNKNVIRITGGEPLLRKDFFELAEYLSTKREYFSWSLMTNGSLLSDKVLLSLKKFGCSSVQVSLEGLEKKNDEIRGEGSFNLIIEKIKLTLSYGMPTRVSLTLFKDNKEDVFALAKMFSRIMEEGDYKTNLVLGARRIVPMGNGKELEEQLLEPKELLSFYERVQTLNKQMLEGESRSNFSVTCGCENGIFNDHIEDGKFFSFGVCGVLIRKIVTVMPDGEIYPCRRLPVSLGNIKKISFQEALEGSDYKKLTFGEDYKLSKECCFCKNVNNCLGGALCVTYAFSDKKALAPDPQCWKLFESINDARDYIQNEKSFKKMLLKTLQIVKKNLK